MAKKMSGFKQIESVDVQCIDPEEILACVDVQIMDDEDPFQSDNDEPDTAAKISGRNDLVKCIECSKKFKRSYLTTHMRCHSSEKQYECSVCDKKFIRMEHLKRHEMIHTGNKSYVCDVCDKSFTRSDYLKRHRELHTAEKFSCDICEKTFARSENMLRHMQSQAHLKKEMSPRDQPTAVKKEKSSTDNDDNKEKVLPKDVFYCNACDRTFSRKSDLTKHFKTLVHLQNTEKIDNILETSMQIDDNAEVNQDNDDYVEDENMDVQDEIVKNEYTSEFDDEHTYGLEEASMLGGHPCNVCKRSFKRKSHLTRHLKTITHKQNAEGADGQFPADSTKYDSDHDEANMQENEYSNANATIINDNDAVVKPEKKPQIKPKKIFSCDVCKKTFNRNSNLLQHFKTSYHLQNVSNTNAPNFLEPSIVIDSSDQEDENNVYKKMKQQHTKAAASKMMTNGTNASKPLLKKKLIFCKICKKSFIQKEDLKRHYKTLMHIQNAEEAASFFGTSIEMYGDANNDVEDIDDEDENENVNDELHTTSQENADDADNDEGTKNKYSCDVCKKSYNQKSDLKRHYKTILHTKNAEVAEIYYGTSIQIDSSDHEDAEYGVNEQKKKKKKESPKKKTNENSDKNVSLPGAYLCEVCDRPFHRKTHLTRHYKSWTHLKNAEKANNGETSTQMNNDHDDGGGDDDNDNEDEDEDNDNDDGKNALLQIEVLKKKPNKIAEQNNDEEVKVKMEGAHSCDVCKKFFTTRYHLTRHQQTLVHKQNEESAYMLESSSIQIHSDYNVDDVIM